MNKTKIVKKDSSNLSWHPFRTSSVKCCRRHEPDLKNEEKLSILPIGKGHFVLRFSLKLLMIFCHQKSILSKRGKFDTSIILKLQMNDCSKMY